MNASRRSNYNEHEPEKKIPNQDEKLNEDPKKSPDHNKEHEHVKRKEK